MWIVPISNLSECELSMLGNNIRPAKRRRHRLPDERANRRVVAAVNRSLAALQERVVQLYPQRQPVAEVVQVAVS